MEEKYTFCLEKDRSERAFECRLSVSRGKMPLLQKGCGGHQSTGKKKKESSLWD